MSYRFGFNGKEKTNEVYGEGNMYDYGFRIYDPRIARFLSVDPLSSQFPWYTPYQFAGNKPINSIDIDGLEDIEVHDINNTQKTAILTIHYTDVVITEGPGAVSSEVVEKLKEPDGSFDKTYKDTWSAANNKGYKLYLNTLPEFGKVLDEAAQDDIDKGNAWVVDIQFDVKLEINSGQTIEQFNKQKFASSSTLYGTGAIISGDGSFGNVSPNLFESEGIKAGALEGDYATFLSPDFTGGYKDSPATAIIHEEGHKWSVTSHKDGDYSLKGMMNNIVVTPTLDNVKDIVNKNVNKIRVEK